ncbi:MAG: NAD-dependent epimerase/dehydratase family protein [Opitutaceae bacterium]
MIFGCGYVGSAVARAALARGWRIVALTRNAGRVAALREAGVHAVQGDLASNDWHARVPRETRYVLDSVSSAGGGVPGYWESYVEGTKSILRWAAGGVPATLVYTSSTSVYSAADGSIVDESSAVGGSETSAPLLEAEKLVRGAREFRRSFILRLAGIYGPVRHHLLDQLVAGAELLPGTGGHRLNLAHRDDIVSAILACFDAPESLAGSTFNVCGDVVSSKQELASWLARRLGRPAALFAHDEGIRGPAPGLARGRSGPAPDRHVSNARIRARLGWRPQYADFRQGYEQIFASDGIRVVASDEFG